jgi:hypothetical protein
MTALRTSPLLCICWLANAFLILFACFMFLGALVVFGPWNGWPPVLATCIACVAVSSDRSLHFISTTFEGGAT